MPTTHPSRHRTSHTLLRAAACVLAFGCTALCAQVSSYGDKSTGENTGDQLPRVLQTVTVQQHLNAQLPLNAAFVDDHGQPVTLGTYFNGTRPAIFTNVYFDCPMLCSEELDGLTSALEMVHLTPGKDFDVVVMSIDPADTPAKAALKKAFYLKRYGRPETADGWHFLTGPEARHRRRHPGRRLRLRPRPRPRRQTRPVRPRQLDRARHPHRPHGAVLPWRRVLAERHDARPH